MRTLFTSWAWPSHYYPMVPLAWALRAAGHEVRVAVPPALTAVVTASGLPAVEVGGDGVDAVARIREYLPDAPPGRARGPRAVRLFADLAEAMADDLIAYCRAWKPDLIVHEPTAYAGPLAAAVAGIPAVRLPWGADLMHRAGTRAYERELLEPLAARLGAGEVDPLGALTLDICPAAVQVPDSARPGPVRTLPMRYVPYHGMGPLPAPPPPYRRRPRVCVSWGTTVGRLDGDRYFAREVVAALDATDAGIVVAVTREQRPLLGRVPDRVKVLESVPLDAVLPFCDLVVGHGGAGTVLTGLVHGLPQLVIPQLIDHTFNAQRFAASGAGLSLPHAEATPDRIRADVSRLLEWPDHRMAAEEIRAEIASRPAPAEVARLLADFVADGTLPVPRGGQLC
ncbi:nucleotide disphospho-sugar-binding domain-containing protein [Streptomyces scopuliridis]|uniref:nucleotide disphospho-sugar-binding domain-containing protein n=1 Tax=Streptomyces scopuliridis TaxID=452529 RepID=UPI00368CA4A4